MVSRQIINEYLKKIKVFHNRRTKKCSLPKKTKVSKKCSLIKINLHVSKDLVEIRILTYDLGNIEIK